MSTTSAASFSSFSAKIAREGKRAARSPETLIGASGKHEVFYIPFEHVERRAKLVLVGITPGPTQLEMAYEKAQQLLRAGMAEGDLLREIKTHAAFGGPLRTNLVKMLRYFGFASLLGIRDEADLWGTSAHLLHSTSTLPHAAFEGGEMFKGSFAAVLRSPALRDCFERHFIPEFAILPPDAVFVALGPTPLAALDHCAALGIVSADRILGALPHPSKSAGSQVDIYISKRNPSALHQNDPVRHRVTWLQDQAERMRQSVARMPAMTEGSAQPSPPPVAAPTASASPPAGAAAHPSAPAKVPSAASTGRSASAAPSPPTLAPKPLAATAGPASNAKIHCFVSRGKDAGLRLSPHVHRDGCYVVSHTRFKEDYIRVRADECLEDYLRKGFSLRMSGPNWSASLILPESLLGRVA